MGQAISSIHFFKNDKGMILTHFSETGKIAEMIKIANKEKL